MTIPLIKLVLIGDYSIFRSALRMLLETERRLRVVGEAERPDLALDIIKEEKPDLILVDLPDNDVSSVLPLLREMETPVLLLIGELDVEVYKQCLRHGVRGLVLKEESSDTLFKAVEKISCGEIWFDRVVMGDTIRHLIEEMQLLHAYPPSQAVPILSDREVQVIELVCSGMKNRDIAKSLFITESTVRHHLTSVFNKFEITSRLELVVYAFKHKIVSMPNGNGFVPGNGHARNAANSIGA